jgi:hypothetical protein
MPGMMDTVLNIGLNDKTVLVLADNGRLRLFQPRPSHYMGHLISSNKTTTVASESHQNFNLIISGVPVK